MRCVGNEQKTRDVIEDSPIVIHTISPEESVIEAVKMMSYNSVGCLIVSEGDKYVGILTERDITSNMGDGNDVYSIKVKSAMTSKICFVGLDDTLDYALRIMRSKGFRHLPVFPVFEEGAIVYVLSIRNIAFAEVDELTSDIKVLTNHVFSWAQTGRTTSSTKRWAAQSTQARHKTQKRRQDTAAI